MRIEMDALTSAEAARELGITQSRIRQLIAAGTLRAEKHGRDWLIAPEDLETARQRDTRPGRKRR